MLTNNRPMTLLNVIYKIIAKTFHLWLIPIVQRFISQQQFAFLSGRNIHHAPLLLSEVLHRANMSRIAHLLLKLDIKKAFDKLKWTFLLALLEKLRFGGLLTNFLQATYVHSASAILINGRMTDTIPLRRSVRQGCPLNSLLFIIAIDALGEILINVEADGKIQGISWTEAETTYTHGFYADDMNMALKADKHYIDYTMEILEQFGLASGLYCDLTKSKAVFIGSKPRPQFLDELPFQWESNDNASKILGIPFAQGIAQQTAASTLLTKLEDKLDKI